MTDRPVHREPGIPGDDDGRLHGFLDAAVAAEQATGAHEETREAATAHLLVRVARITAGAVVTMAGLAIGLLPGPGGIFVVLAGLSILAVDVPFAARLRAELLRRTARATSFLPRWAKVLLVTLAVVAGGLLSLVALT